MNVLDLFSGIGGFSLGLERAGMRTVAFCEIEPFPRAVLRKHWPHVPIFNDVRELTRDVLDIWVEPIDVICGGFPCQDISLAGKGAGLSGERSGLWFEFHRLIKEVRPRYAIIENVAALRSRGLDQVLRSLAEIGYDAEWHCIPACAVGAPHRRDRIWIVANDTRDGRRPWRPRRFNPGGERQPQHALSDVAYPDGSDGHGWLSDVQVGRVRLAGEIAANLHASRNEWPAEPDVGRVAHGVPARVDRLRALGNAVVPQIPEIIARAILGESQC